MVVDKSKWIYKRLKDVCDIRPSKKDIIGNLSDKDEVSFVPMEDLHLYAYHYTPKQTRRLSEVSGSYTCFAENDVIMAKVTPCFENGKIGIASNLTNGIGFGSSEFLVYRPKNQICSEYLYFALSTKKSHQEGLNNLSGVSGLRRLTKDFINNYKIPVPTLEEQQTIATELDTLQSLITQYREQLNDYDKLAQSIFYEMFGDVEYNSSLINYVDGFIGGKSLAGKCECKNKVLKTSAVSSLYFKAHEVKDLPIDFEPSDEYKVNIGDVLISRMNTPELVGACAYVWNVYDNTYLPDRLWHIKIKENINPIFLWFNLISKNVRAQIKGFASGTSGSMKNITKSSLMKVKIMNIPLPLQQQFAFRIESIEAQKTLIKQQLSDVQTLFDSRMQYYFN